MSELKIGGIYRHFKGNPYKVLSVARSSENAEELFVVYETLYENPLGKFWVRPLKMFLETVSHEGVEKPRFEFVGEN